MIGRSRNFTCEICKGEKPGMLNSLYVDDIMYNKGTYTQLPSTLYREVDCIGKQAEFLELYQKHCYR
ncbi:hypothetical protein ADA01nite_19610 [Aneurinibacillus danicus]|uniref:Uncharacterized protein n=1 Tax=Aneurinibacillus danicus TaxID=267746 RepID=A0A511V8G3_9BACL|nr:hypothetical protein ADA01nite_19610 [Aneurinibacillus danicus]